MTLKPLVFGIFSALTVSSIQAQPPVRDITQDPAFVANNSFIFVFKDGAVASHEVASRANIMATNNQGQVRRTFSANGFNGFSAMMSEQAAQRLTANNPNIAYYERNQVMFAMPQGGGKPGGGGSSSQVTPPGITRVGGGISGANGSAWVIDTGVDLDHPDLNVDVARSVFFTGNSADDQNGHGTHVAGTIAAIDNNIDVIGVAAGANVVAVRVLDRRGSGTFDDVIAGITHVGNNASSSDVANLSLGGGFSQAVNDATENAARNCGCTFVIAAGNSAADANGFSPASANGGNILTVAAVDVNDNLASFTNFAAPPIDFAAPGVSILSLKNGGGTTTLSGTSMSAPHVAGLALLGNIRADGQSSIDPYGDTYPIAAH